MSEAFAALMGGDSQDSGNGKSETTKKVANIQDYWKMTYRDIQPLPEGVFYFRKRTFLTF